MMLIMFMTCMLNEILEMWTVNKLLNDPINLLMYSMIEFIYFL